MLSTISRFIQRVGERSTISWLNTAECEQAELIRATADFGVRVYDACLEALPVVRENTVPSKWYALAEMRRAAGKL